MEPAIRCSICTGEQVAGFVDRKTGKFQEVAMIASEEDLEQFLKTYQISRQELKKIF
ncbi:MAG: aspartate dehydrogenase [Lachnospiraceae bacterium]|nr:aspartate dehydrogenase [Lacrimispora saccharolytica]MBS4968281.1 aspartate dehydrogenase [Lachnospiraceae bacterium]MBS6705861.1 aspartate dehydrogenase [Lachnospiraceae bacterium]